MIQSAQTDAKQHWSRPIKISQNISTVAKLRKGACASLSSQINMWPLEKREDVHDTAHIDSHKPFHLFPLAYFILIVKGLTIRTATTGAYLHARGVWNERGGKNIALHQTYQSDWSHVQYLCHHGSAQSTSWQVQLKSKTSVELLTSTTIILNGLSITEGGRKIISANGRWHKTKAGWFCSRCQAQHFLFLQHINSTVFIMHSNYSFRLSLG